MLPLHGPDTYPYRGEQPNPFNRSFTFRNKMICPDGGHCLYHKGLVIAQPITVRSLFMSSGRSRPPDREPLPMKTFIRQEIALPVGLLTLLFFKTLGSDLLTETTPLAIYLPVSAGSAGRRYLGHLLGGAPLRRPRHQAGRTLRHPDPHPVGHFAGSSDDLLGDADRRAQSHHGARYHVCGSDAGEHRAGGLHPAVWRLALPHPELQSGRGQILSGGHHPAGAALSGAAQLHRGCVHGWQHVEPHVMDVDHHFESCSTGSFC